MRKSEVYEDGVFFMRFRDSERVENLIENSVYLYVWYYIEGLGRIIVYFCVINVICNFIDYLKSC